MNRFRRTLSLILAVLMLAGCLTAFTGCGRTVKMPEKRVVDHVYKMNELKMPDKNSGVGNFTYYDGKIYFFAYLYDDKYNQTITAWQMNTEGGDVSQVKMPELSQNDNIQSFQMTATGMSAVIYNWSYDEETSDYNETYKVHYYDKDCKELSSYDLKAALGIDAQSEDTYVNMSNYEFSENGDLFVVTNQYAAQLSADGTLKKKYDIGLSSDGNIYIGNVLNLSSNVYMVVLVSYDEVSYEEKAKYVTVDLNSGSVSEPKDMPETLSGNYYNLSSSRGNSAAGYEFYISLSDGLYGYDMETDTSTMLLDWINSDMTSNSLNNMLFVSDDKVFGTTYDLDTYEDVMVEMTRVPEEELVPKYIITLSSSDSAYSLKNSIVKFNRQSDEYRIEFKSYSDDNDNIIMYGMSSSYAGPGSSTSGSSVSGLNSDILAGNIPDMLLVTDDISMDSYINKGLFTDIYELMNNDETFDKSLYLTNVFKAYEVNGKLYELVPSFVISTMSAKTKFLKGVTGWNMSEFVNFVNSFPSGTMTFLELTRDTFINSVLNVSYDTFVDRATGRCNFEGEEFRQLLEYAKNMRTTSVYDDAYKDGEYDEDFWNDINNAYRNDKAVFSVQELSDFSSLMNLKGYTFYEDVSFVGFPSADKSTGAISDSGVKLAVSSKSPLKDGCWQFLKFLLSDSYQSSISNYGFPVLLSALKANAEKAKENTYYGGLDYGSVMNAKSEPLNDDTSTSTDEAVSAEEPIEEPSEETTDDDDYSIEMPVMPSPSGEEMKVTDDQIEQIMYVLENANHVTKNNSELMGIITEEAAAYFDGKKTIDETVKVIQNRATIFINQSR